MIECASHVDYWFSAKATEERSALCAEISQIVTQANNKLKKDLKDLDRFERFLAVGD